jgi:hypothetical protein
VKQTTLLLLAGLALRFFIIFPGPFESKVGFLANHSDLRNYYWPAQTALTGQNPYALWSSGQSGEFRADMAPLELLVYVGTVALWNDPRSIQVLFALFDGISIIMLGVLLEHSPLKLPFQSFYALGPLTLYNFTFVPEDKTILIALTFVMLWLIVRKSSHSKVQILGINIPISISTLIIVVAALIASFKWLSVFYLLPVLIFVSNDLRGFIKHAWLFAGLVALSHVPWFPSWSWVYAFRSTRITQPYHIAPAALLDAFGMYSPILFSILLVVALMAIYVLYWSKRIDIFETIALATMAGILWTPDMDPVHLSVVTLMFLLMVSWTTTAFDSCLGLGLFVAAVYTISSHDSFGSFSTAGLQRFTGAYASPQMILLSYILFIAVLVFYLADKGRGHPVGSKVITVEAENENRDRRE